MKNLFIRKMSKNDERARILNLAHYFILTFVNLFNFKQPLHAYQAKRGRLNLLPAWRTFQVNDVTSIINPKSTPIEQRCSN